MVPLAATAADVAECRVAPPAQKSQEQISDVLVKPVANS